MCGETYLFGTRGPFLGLSRQHQPFLLQVGKIMCIPKPRTECYLVLAAYVS